MIQTEHEAHQWILTMTEGTGNMARWCSRLSEYKFSIVYYAEIKHQAADGLRRQKTKSKDNSPLHNEFAVLGKYQELFACAPMTEIPELKTI